MNNFTYIWENFISWSTQGYVNVVDIFLWPIIFSVVVGYIYLSNQSATTGAVAIVIIFAAFTATGIFAQVGAFTMFMQLMASIIFTGLVLVFLTRWRRKA